MSLNNQIGLLGVRSVEGEKRFVSEKKMVDRAQKIAEITDCVKASRELRNLISPEKRKEMLERIKDETGNKYFFKNSDGTPIGEYIAEVVHYYNI